MEHEQQVISTDFHAWSELDPNLLGEIMDRLCLADQARFRVVCKHWLAAKPVNATKSLPWCISFDRSFNTVSKNLEFQLYDPLASSNQASVHTISLTECGIPSGSHMKIGVTLERNWLFIVCTQLRFPVYSKYFLLFSPLTRKIITLPRLDHPCGAEFISTFSTFSTEPDSPNCVFFLLGAQKSGSCTLFTYRGGDKWTAAQFDGGDVPWDFNLVYLHGILYIVSLPGKVVSYNLVDGRFKIERLVIDFGFLVYNWRAWRWRWRSLYKAFEFNGELMLICLDFLRSENDILIPRSIRRFDSLTKDWIGVSNLGGKALFVIDRHVATINTEDMRYHGVLADKIYQFFDSGCRIYSIENSDLVIHRTISSSLLEDGGSNLPEYKYNGGVPFLGYSKSIYWLEPPCIRH